MILCIHTSTIILIEMHPKWHHHHRIENVYAAYESFILSTNPGSITFKIVLLKFNDKDADHNNQMS